jgi:hypothetical protein
VYSARQSGDALDLNKLVPVPEYGNPYQGAGRPMWLQTGCHDIPNSNEVRASPNDVDRRLHQVRWSCPVARQNSEQVLDGFVSLDAVVPRTDHPPSFIKRARTRSEQRGPAGGDGGVTVGNFCESFIVHPYILALLPAAEFRGRRSSQRTMDRGRFRSEVQKMTSGGGPKRF